MKRSTMALVMGVVVLVGAGLGFGASQLFGDDPAPTPTPTTPTATATATAAGDEPPGSGDELIDYADVGDLQAVLVEGPDDVSKLTDAPQDFKDFVAAKVQSLIDENADLCPEAAIGIGVQRLMPEAGFAIGGVNACGGYAALWKREPNGWVEIIGTQEALDCQELATYDVPVKLLVDPTCFDSESQKAITYQG